MTQRPQPVGSTGLMARSALIGAVGAFVIGILLMRFLAQDSWATSLSYALGYAVAAFLISMAIQFFLRSRRHPRNR